MACYFGANAMGVRERLFRFGALTLATPAISLLSQSDRGLANRMAYFVTRDMTQDRLAVLAEEYYDLFIRNRLLSPGLELLKQIRREGHSIVLLAESLDLVIDKVRDDFGEVDELCTNRLEYLNNRATGKLLSPIIGGHETARWLRAYAADHHIDLQHSRAYASHGGDLTFLTSVGQPCAVNPDFALRRASRELAWPVIDYDL